MKLSSKPGVSRTPPNPPKFLVVTDADDKMSIVKIDRLDDINDKKPAPGILPVHTRGTLRNSRTDAKGSINDQPNSLKTPIIITRSENNSYLGVKPRGAPTAPPKATLLSRAEKSFIDEPMLGSNVGLNGQSFMQRHDADTIEADIPLGPDNQSKHINDTWSAYWDDAAGAVYYYNHVTGEATWIHPLIN